MDKMYEKLWDITESELRKITKKDELSAAEFEAAERAICILKGINKLKDADINEMPRDEYSQRFSDHGHERPYRYYGITSYTDSNRSRDRMGRYTSNTGDRYGYSRHSIKDRMIDRLESMMDEATTDYERQKVNEFIRQIEMTE